jgi:hypothetical protein
LVYIKEAHAIDSANPNTFGNIEDPISAKERVEVCVRCIEDLDLPIPAIVDDLKDTVNLAYGAHPDRLYLVGKSGAIAYAGGPGPREFDTDEWELAIMEELAEPVPPPKRPVTVGATLNGNGVLQAFDTNGDGKLSAKEIEAAAEILKALDKNGDGELSPEELGAGS